jgi:hypothetical protein
LHDLESFKQYLTAHVAALHASDRYRLEATYMVELAQLAGATRFIDYGPWVGLLARRIFDAYPALVSYVGVDAVPLYLEVARAFVADERFRTVGALLYNQHSADYRHSFFVDPADSVSTSSIYTAKTRHLDAPALLELPAAPAYFVHSFSTHQPALFEPGAYVKIDLDGLDISLMHHYLNVALRSGRRPKVLQFELWSHLRAANWDELAAKIREAGYRLPRADFIAGTECVTLAMSRTEFWYWQFFKGTPGSPKRTVFRCSWRPATS